MGLLLCHNNLELPNEETIEHTILNIKKVLTKTTNCIKGCVKTGLSFLSWSPKSSKTQSRKSAKKLIRDEIFSNPANRKNKEAK